MQTGIARRYRVTKINLGVCQGISAVSSSIQLATLSDPLSFHRLNVVFGVLMNGV